jgi:hypothetical protein
MRKLALLPALLLAACDPPPASSGACRGTLDGAAVEATLVPERSYLARDDQHGGVEHAFVEFVARLDRVDGVDSMDGSEIRLVGHLSDMPKDSFVGPHALPAAQGAVVDRWDVSAGAVEGGEVVFTAASREVLEGSAAMRLVGGGELRCVFVLGRDFARDSDDDSTLPELPVPPPLK